MSRPPSIPPGLEAEVSHLWQFLDQLADSDPAAYKSFIEHKMQERKESLHSNTRRLTSSRSSSPPLFLPSPVFVLYTQQVRPRPFPVYINVCQSTQVQPILLRHTQQPASADDIQTLSHLLIPLSVGKQRTDSSNLSQPLPPSPPSPHSSSPSPFDYTCLRALAAAAPAPSLIPPPPASTSSSHSSPCHLYDVVFHPSTLNYASHSLPLLLSLTQLCLSHIQQDSPSLTLHPQCIPLPLLYRGPLQPQQSATPIPPPTPTPRPTPAPIILPKRGEVGGGEASTNALPELRVKGEGKAGAGGKGREDAVLIEEVSAKVVPVYREVVEGSTVVVEVELPGVSDVSEVTVEMSGRLLVLDSAGYSLTLRLREAVHEDSIRAKWSSKKRTLKLSAQKW